MMQKSFREKTMIGDMEGRILALTDGSLIFYMKTLNKIGGCEICSIDQNSRPDTDIWSRDEDRKHQMERKSSAQNSLQTSVLYY